MLCCRRRRLRPEDALLKAFDGLRLEPHQKIALQERYISVVSSFSKRAKRLDFLFHTCRFLVTTGSLMVPALLSIQYINNVWWVDQAIFQIQIYWATWVISLMVTMSNGVMTLFKFDKAYYFTHTTYELLKSEGWQYVGLTGKYATKEDSKEEATHFNQFRVFYHNAEKIKLRQVEEEYYKFTDLPQTTNQANGKPPMLGQGTPSGPQDPLPKKDQKLVSNWQTALHGGNMEYYNHNSSFANLKSVAAGLLPRLSQAPVDGASAAATATTEIPSFTTSSSVSMQPPLQQAAPTGEAVVRDARMPPIPENSVVSVLPVQSDQRSRASSGDGSVEQSSGTSGEP
jgi:hypothetical protein